MGSVATAAQPNFTILSTDGYWNGAGGLQMDNSTAMGDVDNTNTAPYSLQSQGVFDGAPSPAATGTLADVALYYYKTDLRPTMSDTVPPTNKDPANHQHMVTFTIGLGLDGGIPAKEPDPQRLSGVGPHLPDGHGQELGGRIGSRRRSRRSTGHRKRSCSHSRHRCTTS